ncbi:hypothetical protein MW887_004093 [Aspergillus wentii]|nr:hypothetical protein MW887_004093 [Aspergillus wentii]
METPQSRATPRPACDLCYARKVKCDREEICGNCKKAQAQCLRTRSKGDSVPRLPQITALTERLERLENSTQSPDPSTTPGESWAIWQRKRLANLPTDRARVLSEVDRFVKRMSESSSSALQWTLDERTRDFVELEPSMELLYMMLPGVSEDDKHWDYLFWPDHISGIRLEEMFLALMDKKESADVLLHYRVCVYTKAFFYTLKRSRSNHSRHVSDRMDNSKNQYQEAALDALRRIPFLSPPRLSLVQALLSGAILAQHMGNQSRCWSLTAFAARMLMSLNHHTIQSVEPDDYEKEQIQSCLYVCYCLDRVLSALFGHTPSLPELKIDPVELVLWGEFRPSSPLESPARMIIQLAHVQDLAWGLWLDFDKNNGESRHDLERNDNEIQDRLDDLLEQMEELHGDIQCFQHILSANLEREFAAAEFAYWAIMSSIKQFEFSKFKHSGDHAECIDSARKALRILLDIKRSVREHLNDDDPDPSFLMQTIQLYPLTPFWVLFLNVVVTQDKDDLDLLDNITDLYAFIFHCPWVSKMHSLLCKILEVGGAFTSRSEYTPSVQGTDWNFSPAIDHSDKSGYKEDEALYLFTRQPSLNWVDINHDEIDRAAREVTFGEQVL